MALRLRRGTNAERTAITPEAGELVFTTDTKKVYVGDGTTTGGLIVSGQNDIVDDGTPQLGGDLDLNGNNITGTGNINITGTITATGNINLGDGAGSDIIAVGGTIQGALTPDSQLAYNQGSNTARWNTGYYGSLDVLGHVEADSIKADLVSDDSTLSYNQTTKAFTGTTFTGTTFTGGAFSGTTASFSTVTAASFDGDLSGSVFGDDSTPLVDAVNNVLTASKLTIPVIAPTDPAGGISFETPGEPSRLLLQRNSDSAIGDTTPVGRLIFGYKVGDALPVTITSVSVTNDQLAIIPQPGGTPNYNNYMKLYKTGTVQISMAGEISNAPGDAKLEVGGAVLYEPMTTTVRDALTAEAGMVVFNTTDTKLQVYDGSAWVNLH
jgi:hypothetical protein